MVQIIKPMKLGIFQSPFTFNHQHFLSVAALTFFRFEDGHLFFNEIKMWPFLMERLGEGPVIDLAMPKARSEVLVHGACYAPPGRTTQGREVKVEVGPVAKRLHVFGDRYWVGGSSGMKKGTTDPAPFQVMPIDWAHAFGGPEEPRNPLGKGTTPVETAGGDRLRPLPNVEDPAHLTSAPEDRPEPAGLWMIERTWPQRWSKLGTYDEAWRQTQYPHFALDLDWTHFNAAPSDQCFDGAIPDGAPYRVTGMHPEKPEVGGRLPAIRPRCFLRKTDDDGGQTMEIALAQETLFLFPDAEVGIQLFRGTVRVERYMAEDIGAIMLAYERLGVEPRPFQHYHEAMERRYFRDEPPLELLRESALIPPGEKTAFQEMLDDAEAAKEEDLLERNMRNRAADELAEARDRLLAYGVNPDRYGLPKEPPPPEPVETELEALLPEGQDLEAQVAASKAKQAEQQAAIEADIRAQIEKYNAEHDLGLDFDEIQEQARQERASGPLMPFSAEKAIQELRDLEIATPEREEKLRLAEQRLWEGLRRTVHEAEPRAPLPTERQQALRNDVRAAIASGASLAGRDLNGVDLSGLDLSGMDLRAVQMVDCKLAGVHLAGANLEGALLARSDLGAATLTGAYLAEANLGKCRLVGADLARANLRGATLAEADATEATLAGADLSDAQVLGVVLTRANLRGATLAGLTLMEGSLAGADLTGADLRKINMLKCDATGAIFDAVEGEGANLLGLRAAGARFRAAKFPKSFLSAGTILTEADLTGCDLTRANLGGSDLGGAILREAILVEAIAIKSRLRGADLRLAVLADAVMTFADLENADLTGADLRRASLHGARLPGADLTKANAFSVDFQHATFGKTRFDEAVLGRSILEHWQPS